MDLKKDVIVIGGGAAGLMSAIEAGKRGRSVIVLERSEKIGKKIRISGGGRCNFTNIHATAGNFISSNPHFCKSALSRFTPQDFIDLVEKHGISYHEKKLGQLFCDQTSDAIIQLLEKECRAAGVEIQVNCKVSGITKTDDFEVRAESGIFRSAALVIATGGLSIPKMGATPFGYEIAKSFGHSVRECRPGLVPLTWNSKDLKTYGGLAGISLEAEVRCGHQKFREPILFTHKGLSGPAILQISSYWERGNPIRIDLLPGKELMDELIEARNKKTELAALLARFLPKRFALKWCEQNRSAKPVSRCSDKDLRAISDRLHQWEIIPGGTEGYDKAEVTLRGVDTGELSSKTMGSKKVPGLYFVGEVLDVTGHLGGYNFQWAWASGFAAGISV